MQSIQENLLITKDNLSIAISLFALLATWGNFLSSKRAFLATHYPKIRAELKLRRSDLLPEYNIYNESDKVTANDIRIEISIIRWADFGVFKGKWFVYSLTKLARLKPLETFVPSGLSSDELMKWYEDRGFEFPPPTSLKDQEILNKISLQKAYTVRLVVRYTSNVLGANKVCRTVKKHKLIPFGSEIINSEEHFYWRLKD